MASNKITFIIFTFNEEKRIERAIRNFKDYGNIILADNKSTDKTLDIAASYGCKVFTREKNYPFVENKELVDELYKHIDTEWVYWGFADEMLEKSTLKQIELIVNADKHDIITMDRKNYFYGDFCYDIYNGYNFKVFKKSAVDFSNNFIHGMGKPTLVENRIYKMPQKYFVHHFISNIASSYLNVINRYTDTEVEFDYKANPSIGYLFLLYGKFVLRQFFRKRNYRAGFKGLALIELTLFYHLVKNMKMYEKEHKLDTQSIENKNNIKRDEILAKIYE